MPRLAGSKPRAAVPAELEDGPMTVAEVARRLRLPVWLVQETERRALAKLRALAGKAGLV